MENASLIALSRQMSLWRQLEATANNMANTNTPAYKNEQMMFAQHLVKTQNSDSAFGEKVAFVHDVGMLRDTRDGPMAKTDNQFDVALHGEGYFVVDTPAGQRFTRSGHFRLDETGMVTTTDGYPVMQTGDLPIIMAPGESALNISRDGTVSTNNGTIGKLRVVTFQNDQQLRRSGDSLYETSATPEDKPKADVVQGMLEESNVQPVTEMTQMMGILRNYQGVQKMIEEEHDRQMKVMTVLSQSQK